jgi:hypothetical protein
MVPLGQKGQVTIEALFIFGVFILLIVSISVPNIFKSINAARDVQVVGDARYAVEQLATAAGGITNPSEKRTLDLYLPGYISAGNAVDGYPLIWMRTCIETDGDVLNTTVFISRRSEAGEIEQEEEYSFTKELPGSGWRIYVPGASGVEQKPVYEEGGKRYHFIVTWENITSVTSPSRIWNNCTEAKEATPP